MDSCCSAVSIYIEILTSKGIYCHIWTTRSDVPGVISILRPKPTRNTTMQRNMLEVFVISAVNVITEEVTWTSTPTCLPMLYQFPHSSDAHLKTVKKSTRGRHDTKTILTPTQDPTCTHVWNIGGIYFKIRGTGARSAVRPIVFIYFHEINVKCTFLCLSLLII